MYKLFNFGLNIIWRHLDHENRSKLKKIFKIIFPLILFALIIAINIRNRKKIKIKCYFVHKLC